MKVYVDDIRDPNVHLTKEHAQDIVLIRNAREARRFFRENCGEITVVHLDHFLGDRTITGGDLLHLIAREAVVFKRWPKLETIYLHSSDQEIINGLIRTYHDNLVSIDIDLISNSRPNH